MNIYIIVSLITATIFVFLLSILQFINKDKLIVSKRINKLNPSIKNEVYNIQKQKQKKVRKVDTKVKILKQLANELSLAGILMKPSEFLVIWSILTLVPSGILLLFGADLIIVLALVLIGLFLPPVFVYMKKNKRVELFEKQLVNAVAVMCNCLRSGLTFQQAIESISNEMPEPISKEFGRVIREIKFGNTIEKALSNMSDRINSSDFKLLVSAVLIQRQVGGNLSDILSNIAGTIKERYKIKSEIKVLTTTARTSGLVVGFMPVALLLLFMIIKPDYIRLFFETTIGIWMISIGGVLEVLGYLIIRKMVNIKF
jgi:tight adherence protein B